MEKQNNLVLIGLVGFIGAGKGTVANILQRRLDFIPESFAAPLKDACASIFGWDRAMLEGDTPESRQFRETPDLFWSQVLGRKGFTPRMALQQLGTNVLRDQFEPNIWVNSLEYRIRKQHSSENVILTDARFQNEIQMIRHLGGTVIRVQRGDDPEWMSVAASANQGDTDAQHTMNTTYAHIHPSEWSWVGCDVDHVVHNDGDLIDLENIMMSLIDQMPQKELIYRNRRKRPHQ